MAERCYPQAQRIAKWAEAKLRSPLPRSWRS